MLVQDNSADNTLGKTVNKLFENHQTLDDKELVINPYSYKSQTIFLDSIDEIIIHDDSIILNGSNGVRDFLNLNNIISISIVDDDYI